MTDQPDPAEQEPPTDLHEGWTPSAPQVDMLRPNDSPPATGDETWLEDLEPDEEDVDREADRILAFEAMVRATMGPPEPSDAEIRRQLDRRDAWNECRYTPERLAHINELTAQFYEARLPGSWAQPYLTERLRQDITGHPTIRPGYAPDGWSILIHHLRAKGVTDDEMLTAGVATTASTTGRLIDRFRDRVVFPITHNGQVLGFVGRRNPQCEDDKRIPKYLNTGDTLLFHKGDQLYAAGPVDSTIPVLVEGPMDAIAVTLTMNGTHSGVAPLGTSLTESQAAQLAAICPHPIIATDGDDAGHAAAERDHWLLALHRADPELGALPAGTDPASLLAAGEQENLRMVLSTSQPFSLTLIKHFASTGDFRSAVLAAAATHPAQWERCADMVAETLHLPREDARSALRAAVQAWNADPRAAVHALLRRPSRPSAVGNASLTTPRGMPARPDDQPWPRPQSGQVPRP